jgi:hypothetical protein
MAAVALTSASNVETDDFRIATLLAFVEWKFTSHIENVERGADSTYTS